MNNCHRDSKLDTLIGKRVKLIDKEDYVYIGKLSYNDDTGHFGKPHHYHIDCENQRYNYEFYKNMVKTIKEYNL